MFWMIQARKELEKVKKDVPEPWTKEASERFDKLKAEIQKGEGKLLTEEIERAMQAGRYEAARKYQSQFDPALSLAADIAKATALKAGLETIGPRYDRIKSLLRTVLDDLTGGDTVRPRVALGGAAGFLAAPIPKLEPNVAVLAVAGEVILHELHPDTTSRLDLFKNLAEQAETQKQQGGSPGTKAESLLAVAVSGWIKGKNGADPDVASGEGLGRPADVPRLFERGHHQQPGRDLEELQAIGRHRTLRRTRPDHHAVTADRPGRPGHMNGERVPPEKDKVYDGIWKYSLPATPLMPKGGAYFVRLPDEYHPGRPYPLFIAISHSTVPAEQTLSRLAYEANRNGYILVAPVWGSTFNTAAYDYSGKEHDLVLATRRDAMRRFQVDTDRVVLFGFGEGANFAMDVGLSHPDHFAALTTFGATPKMQNMFREYWQNGQKLPIYAVTGDQAGSSFSARYEMFQKMLQYGFPFALERLPGTRDRMVPVGTRPDVRLAGEQAAGDRHRHAADREYQSARMADHAKDRRPVLLDWLPGHRVAQPLGDEPQKGLPRRRNRRHPPRQPHRRHLPRPQDHHPLPRTGHDRLAEAGAHTREYEPAERIPA